MVSAKKQDLITAEEIATILGISLERLYGICDVFDANPDDQWELIQGQHFEWKSKNIGTRLFYESGAMAMAKYLHEVETSNPISNFIDLVLEKITHRRERTRKMLVHRRVIGATTKDFGGVIVRGDLVFLDRPRAIRILDTNGKGLNAAAKREQESCGLQGREPMQIGEHFDEIDGSEYWSQRGLARVAQNMSENLAKKSRKAWTDSVFEIIEDAIEQQRDYLCSFDTRVANMMSKAKSQAKKTCQVTGMRQTPANPFDLHAHHLFDRFSRPDLADIFDNLLVIHEELHEGFHNWHGTESCEPQDFLEYITTVESYRFSTKPKQKRLYKIINTLEKLQSKFENNIKN